MSRVRLSDVVARRGTGPRSVDVLRGVSLEIAAGEVVMLEGPSGSGKTTLLGVLAGLLTPVTGRVEIGDVVLGNLSQGDRRAWRSRNVGFVFQRSNLLDRLNVWENVAVAAILSGMAQALARRAAEEILDGLGMLALVRRMPSELSGGEEQRVAAARALVHRPSLILADEPTGSLDGVTGLAVAKLLVDAATVRGASVLIATHDNRIRNLARRHVWIRDGRLCDLPPVANPDAVDAAPPG
jgi:putative ABC transport system ATP-binding protein